MKCSHLICQENVTHCSLQANYRNVYLPIWQWIMYLVITACLVFVKFDCLWNVFLQIKVYFLIPVFMYWSIWNCIPQMYTYLL